MRGVHQAPSNTHDFLSFSFFLPPYGGASKPQRVEVAE
jgi:hypothetical protein